MKKIYLDNNATTSVDRRVLKIIYNILRNDYGNPSSLHFLGLESLNLLNQSRKIIADSINADPEEIIFTASGSEGDNLCIKGFCEANQEKGKHVITSQIEHPAVIETCHHLERLGFDITYLPVDKEGFVKIDELQRSIRKDTILVSIMHVNNEIGTIQEIEKIAEICQQRKIAFHSDMVQSYLKLPIDVKALGISLATFSGHKIHAPKGVGFVYKKKDIKITRQIDGGGQENHLRAGTENLPYIVGLVQAVKAHRTKDVLKMKKMQGYLIEQLAAIKGTRLNGPSDLAKRICNNVNISVDSMEGEQLLTLLSGKGICVSTGSACSSRSSRLSSVLQAINCPVEYIHGNIRISLSKNNNLSEIKYFLSVFREIIKSQRQI